jgi:protein TonB
MRELGPLGHCLVEEEGATLHSAQRRRISLLISVGVQAAVLGAMLLVPLLVNGEKLKATILVPGLPFPGVRTTDPPPQQQEASGVRRAHSGPNRGPLSQPPRIPDRVLQLDDREGSSAPEIGPPGSGQKQGLNLFDSFSSDKPPYIPPSPPQPEPAPKEKAIKVSEGVQAARLIHRVMPVYPHIAKISGVQGEVRLRAIIGTDGTVREVVLLNGHLLLVRAATDAVQQWRYRPTLLNGQPVEVETQITVVFILGR